MLLLAALAVGYLCGSFPSAYLIGRLRGKDVFAVGSGSMGAMNTARNLGPASGVAVLLLDVAKGALATYVGLRMASVGSSHDAQVAGVAFLLPAVLAGIGAVAGHCYSVFVGFRGGKGLATALGVALPLYWLPAVYGLVFIVAVLLITKSSDAATLATFVAYPFITLLTLERQGWPREDSFLIATAVVVMVLVALPRQVQALRRRRRPA
ncbi:MAG TPA: glycerol-3-phosphate acyltransferase [Trueperaceae bacterium]|nr:glycerol-3-phosphate acyltransferase [Trueperaceae bacterium]